jgi:glycosyltransferase involved in cell wall biosynthesis
MPEVTLAIIIPTFKRPHSLECVAKSAHENTKANHRIYFVIEPEEWASFNEIKRLGESVIISKYPGNHTGAANTAYEETTEPFFIVANDDFKFHKDWDVPALAKFDDPKVGVVGLNDGQSSNYTAITLVRRDYIKNYSGCIDIPNVLYFPGYNHNYVDTEFSATAKKRGMWGECPESVVEHMHWAFGKAEMDDTYSKSNATAPIDQQTYNSRQHLWA